MTEEIKKKTQKEILIENADEIIELIENGASFDDLSKKYRVNRRFINDFIAHSNYSARAREAQRRSAGRYAELALEAIKDLKAGQDKAEITKQRELAHHYRWLAKVKAPREFNENRVDVDELAQKLLAPTIILKKE